MQINNSRIHLLVPDPALSITNANGIMEYRELGKTNLQISILSFGASPLGDVFGTVDEAEGRRAVHCAIERGINLFDVAPFYGMTLAEERLGKALENKRQNVYVATKCGRYGLQQFDFSYKRILQSIDESLRRLKTDYIDVFQLHDIEFAEKEQIINEAIPAALKIKEMGKARFIGITGLPVRYLAHIARLVEIDTLLSWGHYNLLVDEINDELVPLSKERGFGLMNASPLLQRILSDTTVPAWHRSPKAVKETQGPLLKLCADYGFQLSDVAIRYSVDHQDIATTIVGLAEVRHVKQNVDALNLKIPDALLQDIKRIVQPVKNQMWYEGKPENNIPKNLISI